MDATQFTGTSVPPAARRHQRRRQKFGQGSHPDPEQRRPSDLRAHSPGGTLGEAKTRQGGPGNNNPFKGRLPGPISLSGGRGNSSLGGGIGTVPVSSKTCCMTTFWRSVELLARTPLASTTVRDCVVPQDPWIRGVHDRVVFLHIDVVSSSDILPLSGSISWPGSVALRGIHPPNVTADRGTRTETCWTFARVPPRPSSAHRQRE